MLTTEKHLRQIMGCKHVWIPKSYLDDMEAAETVATETKVE